MTESEQSWSTETQTILQILSDQSFLSSKEHEQLYQYYSSRLKYIKIPVIVISGLNSVLAVGLGDYVPQHMISASTSILALICGILGSIELFLKISENMAKSSAAARELYILHIEIRKTLKLSPKDRGIDAKTYLDNIYTRYIDILNNAKLVIHDENEHVFETKSTPMIDELDAKLNRAAARRGISLPVFLKTRKKPRKKKKRKTQSASIELTNPYKSKPASDSFPSTLSSDSTDHSERSASPVLDKISIDKPKIDKIDSNTLPKPKLNNDQNEKHIEKYIPNHTPVDISALSDDKDTMSDPQDADITLAVDYESQEGNVDHLKMASE